MIADPDPHDPNAVGAFLDSLYPTFVILEKEGGENQLAEAPTVGAMIEAFRSRDSNLWLRATREYEGLAVSSIAPVVARAPRADDASEVRRLLDSLYPPFARMVRHEGDWLRRDYRTVPAMADALRARDPALWQSATENCRPPEPRIPLPATPSPVTPKTAPAATPPQAQADTRTGIVWRAGGKVLWAILVVLWCLWAIPALLDTLGLLP